jgi:hypothetical protein
LAIDHKNDRNSDSKWRGLYAWNLMMQFIISARQATLAIDLA